MLPTFQGLRCHSATPPQGHRELYVERSKMASERPTRILLSKSGLSKEEISSMSDAEAWKAIYSLRAGKPKDNRLEVCFTGFDIKKRQELVDVADNNNLKVVSSVTKKLDFLCVGENAGPKKIEKARVQGVPFLNEEQFIKFIKTGEIPRAT